MQTAHQPSYFPLSAFFHTDLHICLCGALEQYLNRSYNSLVCDASSMMEKLCGVEIHVMLRPKVGQKNC